MFDFGEGHFSYFCRPHPMMHAVIHVVAAGSEHTAILSGDTANVVKAALTAYDEAISVESTRYSLGPSAAVTKGDACSAWIGSVEDAEERCNEDSTCRYLYSHDSDGAFWHVCSSVVYDPTGDATTKIKPSTGKGIGQNKHRKA